MNSTKTISIFSTHFPHQRNFIQKVFSNLNDDRSRAASGQDAETGSGPHVAALAEASTDADVVGAAFFDLLHVAVAVAGELTRRSALLVFLVCKDARSSCE